MRGIPEEEKKSPVILVPALYLWRISETGPSDTKMSHKKNNLLEHLVTMFLFQSDQKPTHFLDPHKRISALSTETRLHCIFTAVWQQLQQTVSRSGEVVLLLPTEQWKTKPQFISWLLKIQTRCRRQLPSSGGGGHVRTWDQDAFRSCLSPKSTENQWFST